ncbi:SirA-like protein [Gottschalkia acidurici 9a]|uniref:SirA-like protein n=1 Tax=Gottschalkia acidurici (strain ATCC 7906 / DSM 604 / BCRC 14475 / CIP 104303 / KCTC 5404 / NCIMB 10678 / 9a) TaxID=1128398 RepID=K0B302_GOTA9|nr:sulfurtransferase TusA family protein [Gottschalkia acidurici]AFS79557.1 SirA-like protein [Gottschalkia acidurici 9a]
MAVTVDARGRSCPEPVMMTKNALESNSKEELNIMVDSRTAVDNIERYVKKEGYNMDTKENGEDYILTVKR